MNNWVHFWDSLDLDFDADITKVGNNLLFKFIYENGFLTQKSNVLEVGFGNGFLIKKIAPCVNQVYGVETSEKKIDRLHLELTEQNVSLMKLDPLNYLDYSFLGDMKFDLVIVNSVVQYFQGICEVKELIQQLVEKLNGCGKLLISDIPVSSSSITNAVGQLLISIRYGFLFTALRTYFSKDVKSYLAFKETSELLALSKTDIENLMDTMKLQFSFVKETISHNHPRHHIMISLR